MKKLILFIAVLVMTTNLISAQNVNTKNTIVIVHGAWSSAADWSTVIDQLKKDGNEVIAVNMAGHGIDNTPVTGISLQGYVNAVKKAIGTKNNIILIGHSFGGIVVSQTAEQIPNQIKLLVYVAAYVPKNGESLLTLANTDAESHVPKYLQIDEKAGIADIAKDGIVDAFVADAPTPVQEYVVAHFKAEPLAPLATPAVLTGGNFGKVNKVYVHTFNDHVIGFTLQQRMVKDAGITRFYGLPSSHTPFVSLPFVLAGIINNEAK